MGDIIYNMDNVHLWRIFMKYININTEHEFSNILCGRLESENFVHMKRKTDVHVLIAVDEGVLNIEIDKKRYKVLKGEIIILPADVLHCGYKDEDTGEKIKYFWAHFLIENKFSISEKRSGNLSIPLHFKLLNYARVRILYNQLLDVYKLTGTRKKYCDFLFTALCCEIAAQAEYENLSENKTVNQAAAWIELNINSPISLSETADALGYNKRYLSRIFKEYTGKTVNEFIIEKKLTLAKQLLTGSDESVTSIASQLGFIDAGYFMRAFKKHEGITCTQYRNAFSKMYLNKR